MSPRARTLRADGLAIKAQNAGGRAPAAQQLDVLLVHQDGACWSPVQSGDDGRGYPRLSTAPARLRLVKAGRGPISHRDTIRITTTEPLPVHMGKQVLGTCKAPTLYYWKEGYGEKQDFRIYRTAAATFVCGTKMLDGDVRTHYPACPPVSPLLEGGDPCAWN